MLALWNRWHDNIVNNNEFLPLSPALVAYQNIFYYVHKYFMARTNRRTFFSLVFIVALNASLVSAMAVFLCCCAFFRGKLPNDGLFYLFILQTDFCEKKTIGNYRDCNEDEEASWRAVKEKRDGFGFMVTNWRNNISHACLTDLKCIFHLRIWLDLAISFQQDLIKKKTHTN